MKWAILLVWGFLIPTAEPKALPIPKSEEPGTILTPISKLVQFKEYSRLFHEEPRIDPLTPLPSVGPETEEGPKQTPFLTLPPTAQSFHLPRFPFDGPNPILGSEPFMFKSSGPFNDKNHGPIPQHKKVFPNRDISREEKAKYDLSKPNEEPKKSYPLIQNHEENSYPIDDFPTTQEYRGPTELHIRQDQSNRPNEDYPEYGGGRGPNRYPPGENYERPPPRGDPRPFQGSFGPPTRAAPPRPSYNRNQGPPPRDFPQPNRFPPPNEGRDDEQEPPSDFTPPDRFPGGYFHSNPPPDQISHGPPPPGFGGPPPRDQDRFPLPPPLTRRPYPPPPEYEREREGPPFRGGDDRGPPPREYEGDSRPPPREYVGDSRPPPPPPIRGPPPQPRGQYGVPSNLRPSRPYQPDYENGGENKDYEEVPDSYHPPPREKPYHPPPPRQNGPPPQYQNPPPSNERPSYQNQPPPFPPPPQYPRNEDGPYRPQQEGGYPPQENPRPPPPPYENENRSNEGNPARGEEKQVGTLKDPFHPELGYPYYTDGTTYFFRIPAHSLQNFLKVHVA